MFAQSSATSLDCARLRLAPLEMTDLILFISRLSSLRDRQGGPARTTSVLTLFGFCNSGKLGVDSGSGRVIMCANYFAVCPF